MNYQINYAKSRPQMYDFKSREQKAKKYLRILEDYLDPKEMRKLTVFDIGSSTGIIDNILSMRFKKVVGGDIDKRAVEFAKQNFKRNNLRFRVEDAMKLSYKNSSFDIVICAQVYEHVPSEEKLFSEIYRILKPGGICFLAAVNKFWFLEPHYNLPFLSWLPQNLADFYVKLFKKSNRYFEHPRSYWSLKKMTSNFDQFEYTQKILNHPKKFGFDSLPLTNTLAKALKYFTPTFYWILKKKS